ncbi:histone H2A-like [Aedes aegypti]|uniref:Histone H2A C-terminal domain-containing protein n=1 Tax=Aedes aegypti TaxID=7159 RepID=A0A6I8U649_AEDAE|nr:histone H2A-like [Aedes aegypti]
MVSAVPPLRFVCYFIHFVRTILYRLRTLRERLFLKSTQTQPQNVWRGKGGKVKKGKAKSRSNRAGLQFQSFYFGCRYGISGRLKPCSNWQETLPVTTKRDQESFPDLQLASRNDEELNKLLSGVTIAQGGCSAQHSGVLAEENEKKA